MDKIIDIPIEFRELYNPSWSNLVFWGGRSSGKSQNTADSLLIRGRQSRKRILCTRQIQNTIKDSVHKLLKDEIERFGFDDYKITDETITNRITGTEFIFKGLLRNTMEIKSMQGIDLCWIEEAQSATNETLDILTPTIRKDGAQLILTYNRFTELDPVHVRFVLNRPPKTYEQKVNFDVMQKYGFLSQRTLDEIEFDRLNNPELFAWKWLGEPLAQNEFSVIPRGDILTAMQATIDDVGQPEYGVDVARMGDDRTVFWKRKGLKTLKVESYTKKRTTEICDLLEAFTDYDQTALIKIDDTGVGGGVTDDMLKRKYNVAPINFGAVAMDQDKYPNLISEAWFYFQSIIKHTQLPESQDLLMELSSRQWKMDVRGRRCIESKQEYKKRGYRSPDLADACILAYYTPNNSATAWIDYLQTL